MNPTRLDSGIPEDAPKSVKIRMVDENARKILEWMGQIEDLLKKTSAKCAEAIGVFVHLKAFDRPQFDRLWETSKENLFEFEFAISQLMVSYDAAFSEMTNDSVRKHFVGTLAERFKDSVIGEKADFDTDRPANFMRFAMLLQSWENHPEGNRLPSTIIWRVVRSHVNELLASEA